MQLYLGIDGGGTKSRCLVVNEEGDYVGSAIAGPSNLTTSSEAIVAQNLKTACRKALLGVEDETYEIRAACFSLAGSAAPERQTILQGILAELPFSFSQKPILTTDVEAALNGAFLGKPGCILIAGTGSICMSVDAAGVHHRAGGLGAKIGDEGSGGWIGTQAILTAQQQAADEPLRSAVELALAVPDLTQLDPESCTTRQIAALSPDIFVLAEDGDAPSRKIMRDAIAELVQLVQTVKAKTNIDELPLALTGGLISGNALFKQKLVAALSEEVSGVQLQDAQLSALQGAVLTAWIADSSSTRSERFLKNLTHA